MANSSEDNTPDDNDFTKPVGDAVYVRRASLDKGKAKKEAARLSPLDAERFGLTNSHRGSDPWHIHDVAGG